MRFPKCGLRTAQVCRLFLIACATVTGTGLCSLANAASINIVEARLYIHDARSLIATLDARASEYYSSLDSNNLGGFGWTFRNEDATALPDVRLLVFLDADIDRSVNTFFNEYGGFASLNLPSATPAGSIAASSWQIDEPGFLFGTVIQDLQAGVLRNSNFIPSTAPDDVSLALGFAIGTLDPGESATVALRLGTVADGGLSQTDPDSRFTLYFNGYAITSSAPTVVPEPSALLLALPALGVALIGPKFRLKKH